MKKYDLPDFPCLLETIGIFLRDANVPKSQLRKLADSRRALDAIARILYSRQAKVYPCGSVSRIPHMPLAKGYPCTGGVPRISPLPLSRAAK
jgi:hypothetical protein